MSDGTSSMVWCGQPLVTVGDVMDVVIAIAREEDREAAEAFMAAYVEHVGDEAVARENIGYISGYYDAETMQAIQRLFAVAHPIFGTTVPTPDEAFAAGQRLGEIIRDAKGNS